MMLKKLLWPTDLSENAARALPFVTSLSEKYQTEVHLLYVLEEFGFFGTWYGDFDRTHLDTLRDHEKKEAEKRLSQICEDHLNGCPLYIRHTATGDPASEILRLIDREKPDLVVMTTRGRKGTFRFGSVAEKVVRHSPAPVLTIPAEHPLTQ